ncbi:CoA-transferase family III domain-containing protein [Cunninghamella echinulata]|nr:CoA-transferase family III domain-containing protein [Cunninghamella echinulata]
MPGYNFLKACEDLFHSSVIENNKISLSDDFKKLANKVKFEGTHDISIPINWRLGESINVLKAFEGLSILYLIQKKYNANIEKGITINTDLAQGFLMSFSRNALVLNDDQENGKKEFLYDEPEYWKLHDKLVKQKDYFNHRITYNSTCTNIYKTKDEKFYHVHGSLNASISQKALGVPTEEPYPNTSYADSWPIYDKACSQFTAEELDALLNDQHGQAGTICYSKNEYKKTDQYKANEHVGLYELHHIDDGNAPQWWDLESNGTVEKPLAGLKVLDITRIIAAPTITRTLAEYGASVMRITSPNLPDFSAVHLDTNNGKWNCELDFKKEEDLKKLQALVWEADVVVTGYRPYHLDKYGLGKEQLLKVARERGRGIIYCRENCYGWQGPWTDRIGWQQISDACCGVSTGLAKALGVEGAVNPILANSDYCTGVVGAIAILQALIERSTKGGSYVVDIAINYYNMWLVDKIGEYDEVTWKKLWESKGRLEAKYYDNMFHMLPIFIDLLKKYSQNLWNPNFFERRHLLDPSIDLIALKPVVQFNDIKVKPGISVPARGNGTDAPYWPKDLSVKQVE